MKRIIVLITTLSVLLASCEKLRHENIIPEDTPRLDELQKEYQSLLTSSATGWYIEYAPTADKGPVSIWMDFDDNGKVSIVADMLPFNQEQTSTYRIGGVTRPEIIFDTYSVWSVIAENAGGSFEFLIYPQEDGTIILRNLFDNKTTEYTMRKAAATDVDDILGKAETAVKLKSFEENASAYFKNLILDNIAAFWEISVSTQQLKLTWEENGETVSETFSYTNMSDGIRLAEKWKVGSIEVEEIRFGAQTSNTLEVVAAGNAGTGEIQVSHIPAFPYKGAAKRFIYSNSFNPGQTPVRFFANTSAVSEALTPYYSKLFDVWTATPSFARAQIYNWNGSNPVKTNSIQLFGSNPNTWLPYYYVLEEADESHVLTIKRDQVDPGHPQYGTYASGAALTFLQNNPEVAEVLDKIYPPEGVTIVPLSGQNVRVVSRANSLYYIDLAISTPATFWTN